VFFSAHQMLRPLAPRRDARGLPPARIESS
jgi:hypothetical protein